MMDRIGVLFDQMDAWRHLPSYQLERRADLFFSLYLAEALEAKLGFAVAPTLIPEFPIHIGTIYPDTASNQSFKVDYLAVSVAGDRGILVELKTEGHSRRDQQDRYLAAARDAGLPALVTGVLRIWGATTAKHKYFCLVQELAELGLLDVPSELSEVMSRHGVDGLRDAMRDVRVTCQARDLSVVYVQPKGRGPSVVSFGDFRRVVARHGDPVSQRFAQSLEEWAARPSGDPLGQQGARK